MQTENIIPRSIKQYEQFNGAMTYASAVKPDTCNKAIQTEDNGTQTDDNITQYNKQTQDKTQEQKAGKREVISSWASP